MSAYHKFNKRCQREGRWDAFKLHREEVKRVIAEFYPELDPVAIGWRVASFRFCPLDGSEHEVELTDQIREILQGKLPIPMTEQVPLVGDLPGELGENEFWLEGDPQAPAKAPPTTYTAASLGLPPPERFGRQGNLIRYEMGTGQKRMDIVLDRKGAFDRLFEQIDRTKRCKPYDMIQWIFENMGTPPQLIDPEDVPSAGSLKYLQDCQENPPLRAEFMKTLYAKTIPDKKQLEHDTKQRDDGRPQLRLIEVLDEEFENEDASTDAA